MISKDTSMLLGVYRVVEFSPSKKPYEGHFKLNNIKVQRDKELVQIKKGDYMVNSNQDAALFIHSVLQSQTWKTLIYAGIFLTAIYSRKSIFLAMFL